MKNIKQKKSICVFCGSKHGNSTIYKDATLELGEQLAKNEIKLVYGGWSLGLMGELSKSVHRNKGEVLGVIPKKITEDLSIISWLSFKTLIDLNFLANFLAIFVFLEDI